MKKHLLFAVLIFSILVLIGCSATPEQPGLPERLSTHRDALTESTEGESISQPQQHVISTQAEPTEPELSETEPQPTVEIRNGYCICPVCGAIYSAGSACWHCSSGRDLGEACPSCGGYTGITNLRHTDCDYCGTMLCGLVLSEQQNYADVHCADCGACQINTGLFRRSFFGETYCEKCRETFFSQESWDILTHYEPGEYKLCPVCSAVCLSTADHCWNCANERAGLGHMCLNCGGGSGITDVRHAVCRYCGYPHCPLVENGASYERVHCHTCGVCQLYRGIDWSGYCNDCRGY